MSNPSTIECTHVEIACDVVAHETGSPASLIAEAQAKCRGCGVRFHTAEQARSAGAIDRVEAARRDALDAWRRGRGDVDGCAPA